MTMLIASAATPASALDATRRGMESGPASM